MPNRSFLHTLIGQEERAAKLFIIILLTVIFAVDIFVVKTALDIYRDINQLIPYITMYGLLPICYFQWKNKKAYAIKYTMFFSYIATSLVIEVHLFWDGFAYTGGSIAEIFFLFFSPIFVNKRFFWVVVSGIGLKYVILGVLLLSTDVLVGLGLLIALSTVTYIILSRFISFVGALNESYINRFEKVVKGIITTLELKDPYTKGHSQRVAEYATSLAQEIGIYNSDELRLIYAACLLHDVGKVHTPDYILAKPDKLTDEEYEIVKQHPLVGAEALQDIENMDFCKDIVLYHHERWDGKGYPEGLRETRIPLIARIAAIADSFDAMTSKRSYRGAMSTEEAYLQIVDGEGSQYDPALIPYFRNVYPKWVELHEKEHHKLRASEHLAVN